MTKVKTKETGTINRNMRDLRLKAGLSQKEIGAKIGLDHRTISSYENGLLEPNAAIIRWYCDYFNVRPDTLMGYDHYDFAAGADWPDAEEVQMLAAYRRRPAWMRRIIRSLCFNGPKYLSETEEIERDELELNERKKEYGEKKDDRGDQNT
jgi:transcriptional regulator with XRE-family HTH domain